MRKALIKLLYCCATFVYIYVQLVRVLEGGVMFVLFIIMSDTTVVWWICGDV